MEYIIEMESKTGKLYKYKGQTLEQETAMTIFAPAFAIPLASDFDPTYVTLALKRVRRLVV
jgi:hypothetical protein